MGINQVREYFLNKPGAVEDYPFDQSVAVFKVGGKMFALINVHEPERTSINLKYYKEENYALREVYEEIKPGYHMHKAHWNTVYLDGDLEEDFIKHLIDVSYDLVFQSLTKIKQKEILASFPAKTVI